jgi:serine/threonine-protein kinase
MAPGEGTIIAEKYRLLRPLARGGMGSIWVARHVELEMDVAVKLVADDLDDEKYRVRFRREAKAAAKLKSPHVVQIHDYGVEDGVPYIVMELLAGEGLDARMARGAMAPQQAAAIISQICQGLKAAHDAGIIHRDLKPSNLFFARSGDSHIVKILDFGIAKDTFAELSDDERTNTGALLGSPRYMSPEQATGEELDYRSDLWSIGVVGYEMLTGAPLFSGANLGRIIADICSRRVAPPSRIIPELRPELDRFFEIALAKRSKRAVRIGRRLRRRLCCRGPW